MERVRWLLSYHGDPAGASRRASHPGQGRPRQGVTPMKMDRGERVVALAPVDSTDNGHDGAAVEDLELIAQS